MMEDPSQIVQALLLSALEKALEGPDGPDNEWRKAAADWAMILSALPEPESEPEPPQRTCM
jgi:hypothetical protein